jgi:hypothetical protein
MPDAFLTLEMLIKEGKAVIGLERVAEAEKKVERNAGGITKEAKKAEAELDRFAKQTTRINATPIEKYRTQMERLNTVLDRGSISQGTYTRATARARAELAESTAIQSTYATQLVQIAATYFTLSRGMGQVTAAMRHARQESESGRGSLVGLDDARRKLAQLATDMPAGSLAQMESRADRAAMGSGTGRDTAHEVLFQAHSYGFEKNYEEVTGLNPIIDAKAGSTIYGKVRQMTGGRDSGEAITNMLIEAGKPSEVDAETLAGPMAIALEGGRRIGGGARQTAAMLSALTKYYAGRGEDQGEGKSGAARVAGDRMRAFAHKVATRLPEFAKTSPDWIESFEHVRGMKDVDRADFLKENEEIASVYEAYNEGRSTVLDIETKIGTAAGMTGSQWSNISKGQAIRRQDPKSNAAIQLNRAQIQKDIERENAYGIDQAWREVAKNKVSSIADRHRLDSGQRYALDKAAEMAITGQGTPQTIAESAGLGAGLMTLLQGGALNAAGQPLNTNSGQMDLLKKNNELNAAILEVLVEIKNLRESGGTQAIQAQALAPLN